MHEDRNRIEFNLSKEARDNWDRIFQRPKTKILAEPKEEKADESKKD